MINPAQDIQDPDEVPYLFPYAAYDAWYRARHGYAPLDVIESAYTAYQQEYSSRAAKDFVKEYRDHAWFRERYDDATRASQQERVEAYRDSQIERFLSHLDQGLFDGFSLDEPLQTYPRVSKSVWIQTLPSWVSRVHVEEVTPMVPECDFVSLSDPDPRQFHRSAWVLQKGNASIDEAIANLHGMKIHDETRGEFSVYASVFRPRQSEPTVPLSATFAKDESIRKGVLQMKAAMRKIMGPNTDAPERIRAKAKASLADTLSEEDLQYLRKIFDLYYLFLREACFFCYFCVFQQDSALSLYWKCRGHHRPPTDPIAAQSGSDAMDSQWLWLWNEKLTTFLEPGVSDVSKTGVLPQQEFEERLVRGAFAQEDDQKYRCIVEDCTKLFKGESFVRKHIYKRHQEWLEHALRENKLLISYVTDADRMLARPMDPSPGGGSKYNNRRRRSYRRSRSPRGRRRFGAPDEGFRPPPPVYRDLDAPQDPEDLELDY